MRAYAGLEPGISITSPVVVLPSSTYSTPGASTVPAMGICERSIEAAQNIIKGRLSNEQLDRLEENIVAEENERIGRSK